MSTTSQRMRTARNHRSNDRQEELYKAEVSRHWFSRVEGRFMGEPIDVDPNEALLHAIRVMAGEVAYCDLQIAKLSEQELFEVPLTVTEGDEDGEYSTRRFEVKEDPVVISRWVSLRDLALDRMAKYAKMALDAGVEERRVQVAERVASIMEPLLKSLADDLDLTPTQMARLPQVLGTRLRALEGTATEIGAGNGRTT